MVWVNPPNRGWL